MGPVRYAREIRRQQNEHITVGAYHPRPWHYRYDRDFGHALIGANDRMVACGFRSMWEALLWAQEKP